MTERPRLTDDGGRPVNLLRRGGLYHWSYEVLFDRDASNVRFGMMIRTLTGIELGGAAAPSPVSGFHLIPKGTRVAVRFGFRAHLAPGSYFLNAGVMGTVEGEEGYLDRWVDVSSFRVLADGSSPLTGLVDLQIDFDVSSDAAEDEKALPAGTSRSSPAG